MKVFELHFNPKKESSLAESFQYKPKDAYEGRLGRLYMVGEIPNPEKKDVTFLENLFHVAKENYYKNTSTSPEEALKETLVEINSFIKEKNFEGKIDIAFVASKNFSIYLTKIGRIKTFLTSNEKIKDIGETLENTGSNLFYNMISGKMKKSDRLIILTHEIDSFFKKGKIIEKISEKPIDDPLLDSISEIQKEKFAQAAGVALIIDHAFSLKENEKKIINKKRSKRFSFKETFLDTTKSLTNIKRPTLKIKTPQIKIKAEKKPFRFPKISKPRVQKKAITLPLLLLGVILFGALIMGIENNAKNKELLTEISLLEENIGKAKESSNFLELKKYLDDLSNLISKQTRLHQKVVGMHESLEKELLALSLGENIESLDLIIKIEEIEPDQVIFLNENLYLFSSKSPLSSIVSLSDKEESLYKLPSENKITLSASSSDTIILFSPPEELIFIEPAGVSKRKIDIEDAPVALSSFLGRPYFLTKSGEINLYREESPISWIKNEEEYLEGNLLAIDGSIFVVDRENVIHRYHEGEKRDVINPLIFPELKSIDKIYTSPELPIIITDSSEGRIVFINKEGELLKQLFHEKLKNLRDITIDVNLKKIYLLINEEVYSLDF